MDFREYIPNNLLNKSDRILEFGPLTRPLVQKKDYPNVFFADIRSTEEIKKLYTSNDYLKSTGVTVDVDSIVDIDFVITKSYAETFKTEKQFDVVILSHVIEHMPDIINFFDDVTKILSPGGKLIIIYPDARYCFDHFRNGTSFVDAYDVYKNKKNPSNRVFDFVFNVIHENNPTVFWSDYNLATRLPKNDFKESMLACNSSEKGKNPEDVHFWPFSDYQFVKFLYDMDRAGLLSFEISKFYRTEPNTQEFMVVLSPKTKESIDYVKYQSILKPIHPNAAVASLVQQKARLESKISNLNKNFSDLKRENDQLKNELR